MTGQEVTYDDVLRYFGTQERMAIALGCGRAAIAMWKGVIPDLRAYQIEVITKGHFKANQLPTRSKIAA